MKVERDRFWEGALAQNRFSGFRVRSAYFTGSRCTSVLIDIAYCGTKRFVVRADEMLTAFLELEAAVQSGN
jgi:hypothetical protein